MASHVPYTIEEQKQILRFIIERKGFYKVKGDRLYKDMVKSGQFNRTYQSLKETFTNRIMRTIEAPHFGLTKEQVKQFREGLHFGCMGPYKTRSAAWNPPKDENDFTLTCDWSSDEDEDKTAKTPATQVNVSKFSDDSD